MPNGSSILGSHTATQGVAITKVRGHDSLYYLFLNNAGIAISSFLSYSIINMNLNGGKGDVVPSKKNIVLASTVSEKMIIAGNCKQWLIAHHDNAPIFYVYDLFSTPLTPIPVLSYVGSPSGTTDYGIGEMKIDPTFKTLALSCTWASYGVELYDFNSKTGIVSNPRHLDSSGIQNGSYGCEFSADASKLYVTISANGLFQYDLSSGIPATIKASKLLLKKSMMIGLRRGPDNMIYVVHGGISTNFSRIRNPNALGLACGFEPDFLPFPFINTKIFNGFGNYFYAFSESDTTRFKTTINVCAGMSHKLSAPFPGTYKWNDNDTSATKTIIGKDSVYSVMSLRECEVRYDTFVIKAVPVKASHFLLDTAICASISIRINARSGSDSARWNDSSTLASKRLTMPGTYWVKSYSGCAVITDSVIIKAKPYSVTDKVFDTTLCEGDSIKIAGPLAYHSYLWSGGNTSKDTTLYVPAKVYLIATDSIRCETERNEYKLSFISLNSDLKDTFICNNDPVFVEARIDNQAAKYLWHTGERSSGILINTPGMNDVKISVGNCFIRDTFEVSQIFLDVNIGKDTLVCIGEKLNLKANMENAFYKWSTGESSREISISTTGEYALSVSQGACTASDSIAIDFVKCNECIAVPNAFTPNQDSRNDIFHPVVKCAFKTYTFDVFNRYGQKIFTSNNSGAGWDGTFNTQPCEMGTYFYQIKVTTGLREEFYKGDVILIR